MDPNASVRFENSPATLARISAVLATRLGLSFPPQRWPDLELCLDSMARLRGFQDVHSCCRWLLSDALSPEDVGILAEHMTIGETYFFREEDTFKALANHVLPELLQRRAREQRPLRIWCAGCCTGEEPYSLAIVIKELAPDLGPENVSILATDINEAFLRKASEAIYGEWSFRGAHPEARSRYFSVCGSGRYALSRDIKDQVTFALLNLAEAEYPSSDTRTQGLDLILCRNVLMYFTPEIASFASGNFHRALVDGGYLVVGATEFSSTLFSQFKPLYLPNTVLYQKHREPLALYPQSAGALPVSPVNTATGTLVSAPLGMPSARDLAIRNSTQSPLRMQTLDEKTFSNSSGLHGGGESAMAADRLERWISSHPEDATAMCLLARAYANQGLLSESHGWCLTAIAKDKANPSYRYLLGLILNEMGLSTESANSLESAIYLDGQFVLAHFALGNLAQASGARAKARRHFRNAFHALSRYQADEILPESDGITAGRLGTILRSVLSKELTHDAIALDDSPHSAGSSPSAGNR